MESWMGRMDTFEMGRTDHVTMPFYPPPCQDHEFPTSRKLKDLEGGVALGQTHPGRMWFWGWAPGTGLAALSLPQGLSLPVVAYIIKSFLPLPFV